MLRSLLGRIVAPPAKPVPTFPRGASQSRRVLLNLECLETRELLATFHPSHLLLTRNGFATPIGTSGPTGTTPAQVRHAYGFDQLPYDGSGTTIAIVDAYDDPNVANDLHQFDLQFNLPDPTFSKVNQTGGGTLPTANSDWASEIALDVEWAHAIAPKANILLVEANDAGGTNLFAAVSYAANQPGVVAVSMSWGSVEFSTEPSYDSNFRTPAGHAGVTFVASSGDSGAPPSYPAASPNVLAVGGTTLKLDALGNVLGESGWGDSGGGVSAHEGQPAYQRGVVPQIATRRANPDVAYDGDPATGFPVYDSYNNPVSFPWSQFGGTSVGAPQWAALIALADQVRGVAGLGTLDGPTQTLPLLYHLPAADFHDITSGSTTGTPGYPAGPGYDLVTGRGSPLANLVMTGLAQPFTVGNGGSALYQLDSTGGLWKYDAGGWQPLDTGVQSFLLSSDGSLFDLERNGNLYYQRPGGVLTLMDGDVQSIAVGADGTLYDLESSGQLYSRTWAAGWKPIDSAVQSFILSSDGSLFDLERNGNLYYQRPGGVLTPMDGNVQSIAVGADGTLYDLESSGRLYSRTWAAGWKPIDSGVQSFILSSDGSLFDLERNGYLYYQRPGGVLTLMDVHAQSIAVGADGTLYDLQSTGLLLSRTWAEGWKVVDSGVQSFILGPYGVTVDVLEIGGKLYQYRGSSRTRLDQNVLSIWLVNYGYTLDALEAGGSIRQFSA
jgi:hypothetical protein